jgi:hypothetical protein
MKRNGKLPLGLLTGVSLALAVLANVETANGQYGPGAIQNPGARPTTSPYLNIIRSGASPAINYYGVVRPEVAFSNSLNQLQQQQGALASQQQDLNSYTAVPPTGHAAGYMTESKYFLRINSAGSSVGGAPGAKLIR